ncbi:MAG: polysaccharide deacetylase family protein [Thermomicrobiales bacterium]|nr:polysaccharide deacetylase family protein [Thermomicrobiales bacterium]
MVAAGYRTARSLIALLIVLSAFAGSALATPRAAQNDALATPVVEEIEIPLVATAPGEPTAEPQPTTASEPTAAPSPTESPSPIATPSPEPAATATAAARVQAAADVPLKLTLGANAAHVGGTLAVSIAGFPANKRVAIYFDGARKATLVTDAAGAAGGSIRVPAATAGLHQIMAKGGGKSTVKNVRVRPSFTLSPTTVQAGNAVTVTLAGFAPNARTKIRLYELDGSSTVLSVWAATTNATGGLTQSFSTKRTLTPGKHKVIATDAAANAASTNLTTFASRPKPPKPASSSVSQVYERGTSGRPEIALTFDAGSDRGHTKAILDTLEAYGIKASFGITGQWAESNPDLVRRMVLDGHMVINHTWSHRSFTGVSASAGAVLTRAGRLKELADTAAVIAGIAYGYDVRPYFRPAYGDLDNSVLRDVASGGYSATVMWSCDSLGWDGASVAQIVARCGASAEAGDIILLHVGSASLDAAALPELIELLWEQGFSLVTVEQLLQP